MAVIVDNKGARAVVVDSARTAMIVESRPTAVSVADRRTSHAVEEWSATVAVASTGLQGPKGERGDSAASQRVADTDLGGHRMVRSTSATGVAYADSGDPTHGDDTLGMTTGAALAGSAATVQVGGPITFNGWAWTPGEPVFLGSNGQVTQAPDSAAAFEQVIGYAESATTLNLRIEIPIYSED